MAQGSRRPRAVALSVAAATVAVAGCSGSGSSGSSSQVLRYGLDLAAQFTNTFDVAKSNGDCDAILTAQIYGRLIDRTPGSGALRPGFATSWEVTGTTKRTLTLHLRPGVVFSDGEPYDAAAVAAGILHNKQNTKLDSLAHIATAKALDPTTVQIELLDDQSNEVLHSFTGREGEIVAPQHAADADKHPVGAGPFMLSSFNQGRSVVMVRNPKYYDAGSYKLSGVTFTQVALGQPGVNAILANNLDAAKVLPDSYKVVSSNPELGLAAQNGTAYEQLQFRLSAQYVSNPLVRQAISYAIDKQQINEIVNSGQGEIATQPFPKASPAHDPALDGLYPFSLQKARDLLAQAGFPSGFTLELAYPTGSQFQQAQIDLIGQQLGKVGIKVVPKGLLGSDIATGYYIARLGAGFSAEKLGADIPADQLYADYGKNQFVAIFNDAEQADLTPKLLDALSTTDDQRAIRLTKEVDTVVMQKAFEVPLAFVPQYLAFDKHRVSTTIQAPDDICEPPTFANVTMTNS